MKFLLKFTMYYAVLFSFICHSADSATYSLPNQAFQPVSIRNQIVEYREIYDEILRKNPKNPHQEHAPRLFEKLKNAFILTKKYIEDNKVLNQDGQEQDQGLYLDYLDTLYKAAHELNEKGEMTPVHFERLNVICALIGSEYRIYDAGARLYYYSYQTYKLWTGINLRERSKIEGMAKDSLEAGVSSTVNLIKTKMNESFIGRFDESFWQPENKKFYPLAILYMDKEIGIGYQTFVNQFFGPYPLFLASFFPSPAPTSEEELKNRRLTKKEVHFSHIASLFNMLVHDFEHRYIMNMLLSFFSDSWSIYWIDYLRPTYNLISKVNVQEQKVLNAGLFLLLHELQYTYLVFANEREFNPAKIHMLVAAIDNFKARIQEELKERGSYNYKTLYRDNEYVLFWAKNKAGKSFVPQIKIAGKDKFLPIVSDERGIPVIILEVYSEMAKVRVSDQKHPTLIPYIVDAEGNMILPKGWKLLSREETRVIDSFVVTSEGRDMFLKAGKKITPEFETAENIHKMVRQKKLDLYHLRQSYAVKYLAIAFDNFWNEFKTIARKGYEQK